MGVAPCPFDVLEDGLGERVLLFGRQFAGARESFFEAARHVSHTDLRAPDAGHHTPDNCPRNRHPPAATLLSPSQSKVMPWPGRFGAMATPSSILSGSAM